MTLARLVDPVSLGSGQKLALRELARLVVAASRDQGVDLANVHPQALPFEPDPVARRDEHARLRPEHSPQRPGRAPEAREGARVEDVGPEARGHRAARVHPRRQRQPGEERGRTIDPRRRPILALDLDPQAPDERQTQHQASERTSVTKA